MWECTLTRKSGTRLFVAAMLAREEIAQDLVLSRETVQTHVRDATRKLGARGRLHAVIIALTHREIDLPAIGG